MSLALRSDVRVRRVLDEAVVIQQDAARVLGLNATGARIVELLAAGRSPEEIVAVLSEEYAADAVDLAADLSEFLAALEERGVIVLRGDGG